MTCASRNPLVLAVTGGIACGKSEVGRILETLGFAVCDTDHVAHQLMKRGEPVYARVVECFGRGILADNGEIDRPMLGKKVFENSNDRKILNGLVHPAVKEWLVGWLAEQAAEGRDAAVQIPLLFESGITDLWDAVVCVSSDADRVAQRLAGRGLDIGEIEARIGAQMPLNEKEKLSDIIIYNNGTVEELEKQTRQTILSALAERKTT
ncbi:MAG: dephospho-CoA kinase [Kiritimatiellales bacterium]|nr:dephospho-CoA kinase [Kiritimatiellales bacterium]